MQQVRKKTVWSDEALDKLLDDLLASGQNKKACAVALAMCSGRRKAELCRFKVDDFKDENLVCGGALYKTSEPIQTKGFGLGKYIYCYTLAKSSNHISMRGWQSAKSSASSVSGFSPPVLQVSR